MCIPCEAGYFCCIFETKKRCPDDTYSYSGMSECLPCSKNINICSNNQALTRCLEGHQTRDAYCVSCHMCKQLSSDKEALPCYRIASRDI